MKSTDYVLVLVDLHIAFTQLAEEGLQIHQNWMKRCQQVHSCSHDCCGWIWNDHLDGADQYRSLQQWCRHEHAVEFPFQYVLDHHNSFPVFLQLQLEQLGPIVSLFPVWVSTENTLCLHQKHDADEEMLRNKELLEESMLELKELRS